jgi:hypothetical protein
MLFNSSNMLPALKYIISHKTGKEIIIQANIITQSALKSASSISQTPIKASKFQKIMKEIFKMIFDIKNKTRNILALVY